MIDETQQDQAALHALAMLHGEEAAACKAALAASPELQTLADEIAETAAAITHALPHSKAPPEVLPRLLAQIRAEREHGTAPRTAAGSPGFNWMPAAIAASVALSALIGFYSGVQVQSVKTRVQVRELHGQIQEANAERERLAATVTTLKDERTAMEKRIADLRQRDAISQVQIATLKVQATALAKAYANVAAYVIWDATGQNGMMRFDKLPPAGPGKDYQMWIIDPRYDAPVSAGIFSAGSGGELKVDFKPERPIALAKNFALSVEQKGGSAKPTGPIVLLSQ